MEFIRKAIVQMREHLRSLTASQTLAMAMILVLVVISLVLLFQANSTSQMVALFDQTFSDAELAKITNQLQIMRIQYKAENGHILVPSEKRDEILSGLTYADALPDDISGNWGKGDADSSIWLSADDKQHERKTVKERDLAKVIRLMPDVASAYVIINPGSRRSLSGGPSSDPSAAVYLKMKPGKMPGKQLITAVASWISKSVDRLTRDRVAVVANGVAYPVPEEDSLFAEGGALHDRRQEEQKDFEKKIKYVLGIPNVLVSAYVELDTQKVHTIHEEHKPLVTLEKEKENTAVRKESGSEPGVRPNTGRTIEDVVDAGEKTEDTERETQYVTPRVETVDTMKPPGEIKVVRATVNVPNSYFERVYRQKTGKDEKPATADLDAVIQSESAEILKKVLQVIGQDKAEYVEVGRFYDDQWPPEADVAQAGTGLSLSVMEYARPAGLGILAISSLMMVLMMLRKASSGVGLPGRPEQHLPTREPPPILETESGPVGEAESTEGILQGVEVDEKTIQVRKMAEQVADLVKEDPSSAAALVRQWMIKDRQ